MKEKTLSFLFMFTIPVIMGLFLGFGFYILGMLCIISGGLSYRFFNI